MMKLKSNFATLAMIFLLGGTIALAQDSTKDSAKDTTRIEAPIETKVDSVKSKDSTVSKDSIKTADSTKSKTAMERAQERAKAAAEKAKKAADTLGNKNATTTGKTDSTKAVAKPAMLKKPTGVEYLDIKVGEGDEAKMEDKVVCVYTVWLSNKGEKGLKLDSSKDRKEFLACHLGHNLVPGWSDGMVGMKPGGIRLLHVPYSQGYGEKGIPNFIPGKSDLIFEIEYREPCTDETCIIDPDPRMRGMLKYVGPSKVE